MGNLHSKHIPGSFLKDTSALTQQVSDSVLSGRFQMMKTLEKEKVESKKAGVGRTYTNYGSC